MGEKTQLKEPENKYSKKLAAIAGCRSNDFGLLAKPP